MLRLSDMGIAAWAIQGDFSTDGPIKARLKAPNGGFVKFGIVDSGMEPVEVVELPEALPENIQFEAQVAEKSSLAEASSLTAPSPRFINGRLLDLNGDRAMEEIQLIIWASSSAEPDVESFEALYSITTEKKGYFTLPYPQGEFSEAYATVGLPEVENVPIRLQPVGDSNLGRFPSTLILVVDAPAKEDCDEECQCEELNVLGNRRVLEEFSYYSVVRTTEPEIKSVELLEEEEISLEEMAKVVPDFSTLIRHSVNLLPYTRARLSDSNNLSAIMSSASGNINQASMKTWIQETKVSTRLLQKYMNSEKGLTVENVAELIHKSNSEKLSRYLQLKNQVIPGRSVISAANPIDWDDEPTIYQATTIAHGHLLQFKQEWIPDGYSLGDLLYSLPLAPGQKKNIVVFDWERRESVQNVQSLDYQDRLYNTLGRDRTINEIVTGSLREESRGGSSASTKSGSVGLGIGGVIKGIVGIFGGSGGGSSSSSSAWQESSRNTTASSLQRLNDRISQSASSARSQRSTVIQTAAQGERYSAQSETIANYNHCHSMTIQYFEVLRHFKVQTRLADVRECLFIPLEISAFNQEKALRWRNLLARNLLDASLEKGFEALEETIDKFADSDTPTDTYADGEITDLNGEMWLRFQIARPRDEDDSFKYENWVPILNFFGFNAEDFYNAYLKDERFKDRVFHQQLGPKIAEAVVQRLTFKINGSSGSELPIEGTLISSYKNNYNLRVSLRMTSGSLNGTRNNIKYPLKT